MSQPFKLLRLQQIDSQLDKKKARLFEIQETLNDNRELRDLQTRVDLTKSKLEESQKSLNQAEKLVFAQRVKIEQTEATLYSGKITNPKELQDLQNEASALKRYLSILEDRQIEAMIVVEEAESQYILASSDLKEFSKRVSQTNHQLIVEGDEINNSVQRIEAERIATVSSISEEDIKLYERLRKLRRGVAVATVVDNTCSACGSTLSASLLQAAHTANQLTLCESCGRIIYSG